MKINLTPLKPPFQSSCQQIENTLQSRNQVTVWNLVNSFFLRIWIQVMLVLQKALIYQEVPQYRREWSSRSSTS